MAHTQQAQSAFWHSVGQKVRTGVEMAATAKNIWNTGKLIYQGVRTAAPYIETTLAGAALL